MHRLEMPGCVHLSVLSLRLSHSALQHLGIPETWGFIIPEFSPPPPPHPPNFCRKANDFIPNGKIKPQPGVFRRDGKRRRVQEDQSIIPARPQVNPRCRRLAPATAGPGRLRRQQRGCHKPRALPAPASCWGKMKRAGAAGVGGWELIKGRDRGSAAAGGAPAPGVGGTATCPRCRSHRGIVES